MLAMTHTYKIDGLSCQNCVEKTEKALRTVAGISSVKVNLKRQEAALEMSDHVDLQELNLALVKAGKYRLSLEAQSSEMQKEGFKQFFPLLVVFSVISAFTFLRWLVSMNRNVILATHDFMGAFFLVFGGLKLLDWKGFADAYSTYDLLAKRSRSYAYAYPLIELGLGFLYLVRWNPILVSWITLVVMSFSSIGVIKALRSGRKIQCACLGTRFKIPMTKITLIEDLLMAFMAAGMIFLYHI